MLFNDTYTTIEGFSEGIYKEKGSKFLAFAFPVRNSEDVKPLLQQLKTEHPKANHHCSALRLTPDGAVFKINDDGEPAGTAGRPILNAIRAADLTDILVVVVRYFGGTLLGVPGLIKAYKSAATDALDKAKRTEKTINDVYELSFMHALMNPVMRIIKEHELKIIAQNYLDTNVLMISIRKSSVNKVIVLLEGLQQVNLKFLHHE